MSNVHGSDESTANEGAGSSTEPEFAQVELEESVRYLENKIEQAEAVHRELKSRLTAPLDP